VVRNYPIEFKKQTLKEENKEVGLDEKLQEEIKKRKKGYFDELVKVVLFSYTEGKPFILNPPSAKFYYSLLFLKGKVL